MYRCSAIVSRLLLKYQFSYLFYLFFMVMTSKCVTKNDPSKLYMISCITILFYIIKNQEIGKQWTIGNIDNHI